MTQSVSLQMSPDTTTHAPEFKMHTTQPSYTTVAQRQEGVGHKNRQYKQIFQQTPTGTSLQQVRVPLNGSDYLPL